MSLRNIFRKKKKPEKIEKSKKAKEPSKKDLLKGEQVPEEASQFSTKQVKKGKTKRVKRKIPETAYKVLISPHVTEKAADLASKNQYVFKVFKKTNKIEIKKAVEELFGVDVLAVKIINVPKKPRRLGRISGWKKGYKKAVVKIKEGQKIDII